jgi:2,4-dienoyl-CoA reductase-like NADH-dependent reductase (Old Yellow Enzyme family)
MSATASTPMILASPLRLPSGAVLKNRVAKGAMSEQIAGRNGAPTSGHERLYERWGASGAGLLITGNVAHRRRAADRAAQRGDRG